jgi:hypothetical protein
MADIGLMLLGVSYDGGLVVGLVVGQLTIDDGTILTTDDGTILTEDV